MKIESIPTTNDYKFLFTNKPSRELKGDRRTSIWASLRHDLELPGSYVVIELNTGRHGFFNSLGDLIDRMSYKSDTLQISHCFGSLTIENDRGTVEVRLLPDNNHDKKRFLGKTVHEIRRLTNQAGHITHGIKSYWERCSSPIA